MLDAYLDHELRPKAAARVRHHLRACTACTALLHELRVVDGLLETARTQELPPNFSFAAMAEIRNMAPPHKRHGTLWIGLAMYLVCAWIAASVAIAVARGGRWSDVLAGTFAAVTSGNEWHAIAGMLHAMSGFTPFVVPAVVIVLAVDVALIAAVFFFYRAVRPWLAARLADGEIS
jgi:anti-sigma factor RsiW